MTISTSWAVLQLVWEHHARHGWLSRRQRDMRVLQQVNGNWSIDVLQPASSAPNLNAQDAGYVEFAGFSPAGQRYADRC